MSAAFQRELEWLKREGGVPLPAPRLLKGCRLPKWPGMPEDVAWAVTRAWLAGQPPEAAPACVRDWLDTLDPKDRRKTLAGWRKNTGRPINLSLRTSELFGVADIDELEGAEEIIAKFPAECPVDRSARGKRIYFRPAAPIGNGELAGIKGEFFTATHLVSLPGSLHPSGFEYRWVRPPNGPLPVVDIVALGLAVPKDKVSITRRDPIRRDGGLTDVRRFMRELTRLLGEPRTSGRWALFRCPWHAGGSEENPSLGVTPDGWCQCFACGERGWADTVLGRLTGCNGNFVSDDAQRQQQRVIEALKSSHLERLAHEMSLCGRMFKVHECELGHFPAFAVSCKSPYCPRCRGRRLSAHLAKKADLFDKFRRPVGVKITMPTLAVAEATDARRKLEQQSAALLDKLRTLADRIPQMKNIVRVVGADCHNLQLSVRHAFVVEDLTDKQSAVLKMALAHITTSVDVSVLESGDDASRWLYRRSVGFSFSTNEDLVTLLLAFKGISIVRGWGAFRAATGGMLKGVSKTTKRVCPFCGSELGPPITEVPADQVEWAEATGWRLRAPPGQQTMAA